MFEINFSGVALCFAPLLLTIGLFIYFAARTDAHARRTYLRRLDPRPESERLGEQLQPVDRAYTAATPAGPKVTFQPEEAGEDASE